MLATSLGKSLAWTQEPRRRLAQELARSPVFVFVAAGSQDAAWDVWLAADLHSDPSDDMARAVLKARAAARTAQEIPDPDEAEIFGWSETGTPVLGWIWRTDEPRNALDTAHHSPVWSFFEDGLPVPMAYLCTLTGDTPLDVIDESRASAELDSATAAAVSRHLDEVQAIKQATDESSGVVEQRLLEWTSVGTLGDGGVVLSALMMATVETWTSSANHLLRSFLVSPAYLQLVSNDLTGWLTGTGLVWQAGGLPVEQLSRAGQRWAAMAITFALSKQADLVIIDEPEASLHRSGEEHLARGLTRPDLAQQPWLLATHSPMLLDDVRACYEVIRVESSLTDRKSVRSQVRSLEGSGRESLGRLGLHPSDLMHRHRVIVLVEGVHDEIVINNLLERSLDRGRAMVVPLHGASQLKSSLDAEFLLEYTSAHLVAVLDNLQARHVEDTWFEAQRLAWSDTDAAVEFVLKNLPSRRSAENKFMSSWLTAALRKRIPGRVTPYGLSAGDIIEYLPVDQLVPRAGLSWPELRAKYDREIVPQGSGRSKSFKVWLTDRHKAQFGSLHITEAVGRVRETPSELSFLGQRIEELGAHPHQTSPKSSSDL